MSEGRDYAAFAALAEQLLVGLNHILDTDDLRVVDRVVTQLACELGERPDAWDGAANLGLIVAESLIDDEGPFTMPEGRLRANSIVTCFIIVRLMTHPMMQPIIKQWEENGS